MATLYDVLGVPADASAGELRGAYRRAARQHHPDLQANDPSAARRMTDVNHAWAVLGDPGRRAEYDSSLTDFEPLPSGPAMPASAEPKYNPLARYQDPPRFPWRFMAVLAVLGILAVAVGVVTAPDPRPPTVDNVLHAGECVAIEANGMVTERLCTEAHDGVVQSFASTLEISEVYCIDGAEAHRDQQGLGIACVVDG